ncbi:MAG: nucleoside hydrolase [Oscillospiraceae bacterium]|nr:nucleoside hydrolase [Oscillospiraceae bacterium]
MSELKRRPVIIDCDPGTDDAICIFMMMANDDKFDILGITPVNGNIPLANCERNALQLCELMGLNDMPVLKGASKAMFREQRDAGAIHGAGGLGNVVLPDPVKKLEDEYAWDFIYRQAVAHKGELEILAVGPLTNLGIAFTKYPDLKDMVKQIVIMGGANGLGNHGTVPAEFNIWADPESAKITFKAGVPMAMMGLDVCYEVLVTPEAMTAMRASGKIGTIAADLIQDRVDRGVANGKVGGVVCDAVAAAYMIDPSIIETEYVHVDVECKGKLTEGKTVVTRRWTEHIKIAPNTHVGITGDVKAFNDMLVAAVQKLDAKA